MSHARSRAASARTNREQCNHEQNHHIVQTMKHQVSCKTYFVLLIEMNGAEDLASAS